MPYQVRRVLPGEGELMHGMLTLFSQAFDDPEAYDEKRPSAQYLDRLLAGESFIALVAVAEGALVGALAAYELRKFEQERSELYIYDLAVREPERRRGIATALIEELRAVAKERGAYVVDVQADYGDDPAIALYTKLGTREDVMHFDIPVTGKA